MANGYTPFQNQHIRSTALGAEGAFERHAGGSVGTTGDNIGAAEMPPIQLENDRVDRMLDQLTEIVERLEKRLSNVLRAPEKDVESALASSTMAANISPLARSLRVKGDRISHAGFEIELIISRLEV